MRAEYEVPKMDVVEFDAEDVIVTSGGDAPETPDQDFGD